MREYVTDAIVLKKDTNGDADVSVSFFTKRFGKLRAKAKSARKITSKLSAHLEPGNVAQVRIVEKNGLNIADALKRVPAPLEFSDLYYLDRVLAEAEPDGTLWRLLLSGTFTWKEGLKILGWDPEEAICESCGRKEIEAFHIDTQGFFCGACIADFPKKRGAESNKFLIRISR